MADLNTFFTDVLKGLGLPTSSTNLQNMLAWHKAEGGWTNNSATFNPLNTNRGKMYPAMNSHNIRRYPSYNVGVKMTVATLRNGHYGQILDALKKQTPLERFAQAVYASPWGTKRGIGGVSAANSTPSASPALPAVQGGVTTEGRTGLLKGAPQLDVKSLNALAKQFGFKSFSQAYGMDDGQLQKLIGPRITPTTTLRDGTPVVNVTGKTPAKMMQVLSHVNEYLGTPYKWGGKNPQTGFDCSGLVQYLYKKAGVDIPGYTIAQYAAGKPVAKGKLRVGDVVFFNWGTHPETGEVGPNHVGLYMGNGMFLQSPKTGDVVKISSMADRTDFVGGRRYI